MSDHAVEGESNPPLGRPTLYAPEIAAEICLRLGEGESLRSICRSPHMPSKSAVLLWVVEDREGFSDQYRRAREAQLDHYRDEMVDIADDGSNDFVERERRDGSKELAFDREHVQRSALRISTRQWVMERQAPKVWGPKAGLDLNHSGQVAQVVTYELPSNGRDAV